MKTEILYDGTQIDKIGFGTWTIGGRSSADPSQNDRSLIALRAALDLGYTHFDTAEMYADGHSETLLGQAVKESKIAREKLFITTKVHPENLGYEKVRQSFEKSLARLDMDYVDLYLIHWATLYMPLEATFQAFNELVDEGKIRYLGVSSFSVKQMQESQIYSETPLVTNQVSYSLGDREYVDNGVLAYCLQNDMLVTAYSPVNVGKLKVDETLQNIADAHGATPYQIALAWLVQQPKVITIPMSFNPQHQAENLAAVDITLTDDEMTTLNSI